MQDPLLTVEELAAKLAVSPRTVWRMLRDGQVPVRWVRESARFVWAEVLAGLPAGRQKPVVARAMRRVPRGVSSMVEHLKRKVESWPST